MCEESLVWHDAMLAKPGNLHHRDSSLPGVGVLLCRKRPDESGPPGLCGSRSCGSGFIPTLLLLAPSKSVRINPDPQEPNGRGGMFWWVGIHPDAFPPCSVEERPDESGPTGEVRTHRTWRTSACPAGTSSSECGRSRGDMRTRALSSGDPPPDASGASCLRSVSHAFTSRPPGSPCSCQENDRNQ
jgi:hypothetical protein